MWVRRDKNTPKRAKLIETRRSIRKFKAEKPVTEEQPDRLPEAAMLAPYAFNTCAGL